jgi:predicted nucleotide-binding protein
LTRKKTQTLAPKPPAELIISRDEAKSKLQERIQKGLEIKQIQIDSNEMLESVQNEHSKWNSFNHELLKRIFTTEELAEEYSWWSRISFLETREPSLGKKIADLHGDVNEKIHRIESIMERLELFPLSKTTTSSEQMQATAVTSSNARSKKIFVVHGHDETAKASLEVFLHEIGLEPIVLHRQADEGLTIIEKFEKHSDVGYAFILLTPDEIAYLRDDENKPDIERRKEARARPNVIFEFGYFVGKLGRSRVCCLYTGEVSLPSDVNGMIYKKFNTSIEEVAYGITKDLKASGYEIA